MTKLLQKKISVNFWLPFVLLHIFSQNVLHSEANKTNQLPVFNLSEIKGGILLLSGASYIVEEKGWRPNDSIRARNTLDSILTVESENSNKSINFKKVTTGDYFNIGPANQYYWFKINFQNEESSPIERFIRVESQELVDIHIFVVNDNNVIRHLRGGRETPVNERSYYSINHIFPVEFSEQSITTIYIRVYSPLVLWMTLHTPQSLAEEEYKEIIPLFLFYGIFIAVLFYNTFIGISILDRTYAYYIGHVFCLGLFFFVTNGFVPLIIPSLTFASPKIILTSAQVSIIFYLLFISSFLDTRNTMPKVNKLLIYSIPFFAFSAISWSIFGYPVSLKFFIQPLSTVFIVVAIGVSIYAVAKGYKPARMLLYGTLFYQIGALITGLVYTGRIPLNFFTFHAMQFGFTIEMLLLSLALGDKMKRLKLEKETAEQHEIQLQQKFSRQILESQENERKRIAGELHDSIGQNFIIIKNWIEIAIARLKKGEPNSKQLEEVLNISTNAIEEVRTTARNLYPYQLEQIGLKSSLEMIGNSLSHMDGLTVNSLIDDVDSSLIPDYKTHIFRIVQETFNNIIKHSKAKNVSLTLKVDKKIIPASKGNENLFLFLQITDDGIGFDVSNLYEHNNMGFGLSGIRERARILGAELNIDAALNKGTNVSLLIPADVKKDENKF